MTLSERRFAPITVRQARNAVRHGLEQVSDSVGMRNGTPPKAEKPSNTREKDCLKPKHRPQITAKMLDAKKL